MRCFILALAMMLSALVWEPAPAGAQTSPIAITPEICRGYLEQYGTTASDAALTFQGGSLEAQQVAFCQSLAYRGERDALDLDQAFTRQADTDRSGTVDQVEFEAYFASAREGGSAPVPVEATSEPVASTAGTVGEPARAAEVKATPAGASAVERPAPVMDAGGSGLPVLIGVTVLGLLAAALVVYRRTTARP